MTRHWDADLGRWRTLSKTKSLAYAPISHALAASDRLRGRYFISRSSFAMCNTSKSMVWVQEEGEVENIALDSALVLMREKIAKDEKWEQTHVDGYYDRENLVNPYHASVIVNDDSFSASVLFVMTLETSVQSAKCRKHKFLWSPKCRKDNQAEARILQVSKARGLCRRK